MKLFLGLLTSHHLRRLKRLVRSIQEANHEPNVDLNPVIVVNTLNDSYYKEVLAEGFPYPVVRTESNGSTTSSDGPTTDDGSTSYG